MQKFLLTLFLSFFALPLWAANHAAKVLMSHIESMQSLTASFHQRTIADGQITDQEGVMALKKPHRFDWQVQKPMEQRIIANSTHVYLYDPDLMQVIVKPLDQALSTPMSILAGNSKALAKHFNISASKDLQDFTLTPKQKDQMIKKMVLHFSPQHVLTEMTVQNNLDQTMHITLSDVKINPKLSDRRFDFTPPKGVDVYRQ